MRNPSSYRIQARKWLINLCFHIRSKRAGSHLVILTEARKRTVFLQCKLQAPHCLKTFFFKTQSGQRITIEDEKSGETKWIQKLYNNQREVDSRGDWAISRISPLPFNCQPLISTAHCGREYWFKPSSSDRCSYGCHPFTLGA